MSTQHPAPQFHPHNAYTDAPALHPGLILGSLHLIFWLFFHPSAWRNHVVGIDPTLRPDFCLAELSREQWRNPALYYLIIQGYSACLLIVGILTSTALWIWGVSGEYIVGILVYIFSLIITIGLVVGLVVGVSAGVVSAIMMGLAIGVVASTGSTTNVTEGLYVNVAGGVAVGIAGGIVASVANPNPAYTSTRQIGGIVIGALIGSGAAIVIALVAGGVLGTMIKDVRATLSGSLVDGMIAGVIFGVPLSLSFALPYVLASRIAGPGAGGIAGALGNEGRRAAFLITRDLSLWFILPFSLIGVAVGISLARWRPILLYPFLSAYNLLLLRADQRRLPDSRPFLRYHPVFWEEHQRLRWIGLDEHLVLIVERNPTEGQQAINYLANSRYQFWAAQSAQIELDARRLEHCTDVEAIGSIHATLAAGELEGPVSALLRSFSRISRDVDAALRQESTYNRRLALSAVEERLDGLLRELTRSSERYALRFRPIVAHWRQIASDHVRTLATEAEARQEIDSPYIIGVPLTAQQAIFIGRTDISTRIEQLLLDRRRPPLLLYGQRRMGKTSLLNNLGRLLPSSIVPFFVDLQGAPTQASDHTGLLYNIARSMIASANQQRGLTLPLLNRDALVEDPFTVFDEWLDAVEHELGECTALLSLDEFEALDRVIAKERFDEERVLGMLRNLIQHRLRFKVLLAGSHTLEKFRHWASYLINAQLVHLSYLREPEAHQLIEHPVENFALHYEPNASQRVLDLTRGHPFLIQLLCAEIVALKNAQPLVMRRLARVEDVQEAVPAALASGDMFFADIAGNQVDTNGLALLHFLAAQGEGATVGKERLSKQLTGDLDAALQQLLQRELIEGVEGGYRFQVELIRHWFDQ